MKSSKKDSRTRRKLSIRKKLHGTSERPRVYVYKSNKSMYVGVADDTTGKVMLADKAPKNIEAAKELGKKMSGELKKLKIESIVFDRSGYKYHGRVQAFADSLREGGIQF